MRVRGAASNLVLGAGVMGWCWGRRDPRDPATAKGPLCGTLSLGGEQCFKIVSLMFFYLLIYFEFHLFFIDILFKEKND